MRNVTISTGVKPFSCSLCTTITLPTGAVRFHSSEKPFSSSHCTNSLALSADLKNICVYIGIYVQSLLPKQLACKYIEESPLVRNLTVVHNVLDKVVHGVKLKRNTISHNCERTCGCPKCTKSFSQSDSLRRHLEFTS